VNDIVEILYGRSVRNSWEQLRVSLNSTDQLRVSLNSTEQLRVSLNSTQQLRVSLNSTEHLRVSLNSTHQLRVSLNSSSSSSSSQFHTLGTHTHTASPCYTPGSKWISYCLFTFLVWIGNPPADDTAARIWLFARVCVCVRACTVNTHGIFKASERRIQVYAGERPQTPCTQVSLQIFNRSDKYQPTRCDVKWRGRLKAPSNYSRSIIGNSAYLQFDSS
jgi:hypothetical protein